MNENLNSNIFILGDSTSMTLGCENHMYPYLLSRMKVWKKNTKIKNFSLAGNTSSDIASLFFNKLKSKIQKDDIVIIYLGNCDAASSEIIKGKYSFYQHVKNKVRVGLSLQKRRRIIKNKLRYYSWDNSFDPDIEFSVRPNNFKYNLKKIIKECNKKNCRVLLIKAEANENFPPGVGKGNFIFYKYVGLEDKLSKNLDIEDKRFIKALKHEENKNYQIALKLYNKILLENCNHTMSQEYSLMIVNNIAVIKVKQKLFKEAEYIFKLLLKEKYCRKEIIYFNLSQLYKLKNNEKQSVKYKVLSYETDASLYRIRKSYKEKIDEIVSEMSNISLIKMKKIVSPSDYLDHCHLTLNGQEKLAKAIIIQLNSMNNKGDKIAKLENTIYNPETFSGNFETFSDYFRVSSRLKKSEIKDKIFEIINEYNSMDLEKQKIIEITSSDYEIDRALKYYIKHPLFEVLLDLKINYPSEPYDIGRFPEFYLTRLIIPYLKQYEIMKKKNCIFKTDILRKSGDLEKILFDFKIKEKDSIEKLSNKKEISKRVNRIIKKSYLILKQHLENGNQVNERKKTTIFWYFRETLRFGSHSRISMLYERVTLEYVAEGLAVAFLLNMKSKLEKTQEISKLIDYLEKIVITHERFCKAIHKNKDNHSIINNYETNLKKLREQKVI